MFAKTHLSQKLLIALFLCVVGCALPQAGWAERKTISEPSFAAFDASVEKAKEAMMGDPEEALKIGLNAVAQAEKLPASNKADVAKATAGWLHGEALIGVNAPDKAATIIAKAIVIAEKAAPNSKLHGDLLRSRGAISAMKGDVLSALRDYQSAYQAFLVAKVPRSQAIALQDIGQIYWEAADYDRVLEYLNQSAEAFSGDPALTMTTRNDRAEVYRKLGRYDEAAKEYRAALAIARTLKSPMLETRILTNLAGSEADAGRLVSAQAAASQAMQFADHNDAAGWRPFVFGIGAKIAVLRGDTAQAELLFARAFDGVDLAKSDMLFREYHQSASQLYEEIGDKDKALAHLKAFQRLEAEAQSLTASAASQLLAAKFDFANQKLKISQLKEGQLKRDIHIERQKTTFRTTLFLAIGGAASIVFGLILFGYLQMRKNRNQVRAANDSLTVANVSLEKALQAKTEFLAMTSHEIRTPLNGILGMTQILLADRSVDTNVRERIEVVNSAGETMRALVDDILDVAKMESGELTIAHAQTDLHEIVRETTRLWSGQAEAKQIELIVESDEAPRMILSDGGRIRQMLFNLMSNALKFTDSGSVTLSVAPQQTEDGVEQLVLSVTDTGIGIAPEHHAHIFESFKQVDAGMTRQFSGTGLGLAICQRLATALGGTIDVVSELDKGSTFTIRVPLVRAGAEDFASGGAAPADTSLENASLLVVDGNASNLAMLAMMLAGSAGSIAVAKSIDHALEILDTQAVSHIVFDAGCAVSESETPDEAFGRIVDAAAAANALISITVAPGPEISIANAMTAGASQVIVKPIGVDELVAALQSLYGPEPETFVAPSLNARAA
jgi:signal transduction histidine kinase/ActR/RegA family two-component response regulator